MSIPTPALLAFVVLIGWPLVQLASTLYLRRHRRQMKELARELRADPRYQGQDLRLIDAAVRDARPQPAMYFMPFFVFFLSIWEAFSRQELEPMTSERVARLQVCLDKLEVPEVTHLPIWSDPRLTELRGLSDTIAFLRTPFSLMFIGVALALALPFLLLAFGLRWSAKLVATAAMKQLTYALKLGTATKGISQ